MSLAVPKAKPTTLRMQENNGIFFSLHIGRIEIAIIVGCFGFALGTVKLIPCN